MSTDNSYSKAAAFCRLYGSKLPVWSNRALPRKVKSSGASRLVLSMIARTDQDWRPFKNPALTIPSKRMKRDGSKFHWLNAAEKEAFYRAAYGG